MVQENFPELIGMTFQTARTNWVPNTKNEKIFRPKHIIIKFQKLMNKQKLQNTSRKKNRSFTKIRNQKGIGLLKKYTESEKEIQQCLYNSKEKSFPVQNSISS